MQELRSIAGTVLAVALGISLPCLRHPPVLLVFGAVGIGIRVPTLAILMAGSVLTLGSALVGGPGTVLLLYALLVPLAVGWWFCVGRRRPIAAVGP